jgi:hypothetical protein
MENGFRFEHILQLFVVGQKLGTLITRVVPGKKRAEAGLHRFHPWGVSDEKIAPTDRTPWIYITECRADYGVRSSMGIEKRCSPIRFRKAMVFSERH